MLSNNLLKNLLIFLAAAAIIFVLEKATPDGSSSMMFTMLFFVAVSMGPIAVIAAVDICESDWAKPYKRDMLSTQPMILFIALLFAAFALSDKLFEVYAWSFDVNNVSAAGEPIHRNWLSADFFYIRNLLLLLVSWLVAGKYASVTLNNRPGKVMWAIFYIFAYVITQTMVAFDWVMSLEFPWLSTLFGAYFFVEAFYSGLALAAVFTFFFSQYYKDRWPDKVFKKSQMDMMTMMFGFSIFWAYQFFSQLIVIWYGNIPEEVGFFVRRLELYSYALYAVLFILFFIPFWTLMSRKVKANARQVMIIAFVIWGGILLERFFMIHHHMHLSPWVTPLQFAVAAAVFVLVIKGRAPAPSPVDGSP